MKAVIIEFSPSNNTHRVGELLKANLEQNNISVQLVNIAADKRYFLTNNKKDFLQKTIDKHDILIIGSPVYAHHLQYHIKYLIKNLPKPVNGWGKVAVPFVTYGGINSGIALDEAGKLLRKSGRKVLAGMKVSCSHHMSRAFMEEEYNKDQAEEKLIFTIGKLVKRITLTNLDSLKDNSKSLKYQDLNIYLKSNLIFREKTWHKKRYPKIVINDNQCTKCGKCIKVCPVCHLDQNKDKSIIKNMDSECIHCFNCIFECPQKAITPIGNLKRAKAFMESAIQKGTEYPDTCLYPKL
ncbi:EFR1 family ferrodoxin [Clostridium hydrogenum]|uniref:EFR1 family ferrodoxin n=1 Tax=Clostridium hydrogenum TaxID=2855764 RepID=UPI001F488BBA|nr:EFR1 family ferrodoxin [Clostridium hydrogenum]